MLFNTLSLLSLAAASPVWDSNSSSQPAQPPVPQEPLQVFTHINTGPSLDVVSSLIVGCTSAVLIDMPLAIPQAEDLAQWIRNVTDKPLVAAFTTHYHPDHYLSGEAVLKHFPDAKYYANPKAAALIENERKQKAAAWGSMLGNDTVVQDPTVPIPYDLTFFALPGDEDQPIHLLSPLNGDAIDETLFWIPSTRTLIAGDSVYSHQVHLWLADLLTPSLTESWLSTLDFIANLEPNVIIPGHALNNDSFTAGKDLEHSRKYVEFFQQHIEALGPHAMTPEEISANLTTAFPGLLNNTQGSTTSATLVNISAEQFGFGGTKQVHYVDLEAYNNVTAMEGWDL